jgi:hypothetical protein
VDPAEVSETFQPPVLLFYAQRDPSDRGFEVEGLEFRVEGSGVRAQ